MREVETRQRTWVCPPPTWSLGLKREGANPCKSAPAFLATSYLDLLRDLFTSSSRVGSEWRIIMPEILPATSMLYRTWYADYQRLVGDGPSRRCTTAPSPRPRPPSRPSPIPDCCSLLRPLCINIVFFCLPNSEIVKL